MNANVRKDSSTPGLNNFVIKYDMSCWVDDADIRSVEGRDVATSGAAISLKFKFMLSATEEARDPWIDAGACTIKCVKASVVRILMANIGSTGFMMLMMV